MQINKRKILLVGSIFLVGFIIFLFFDKGQSRSLIIGEIPRNPVLIKETNSEGDLKNKLASDKIADKAKKETPALAQEGDVNQTQSEIISKPEDKKEINNDSVNQGKLPKIINRLVTWGFTPTSRRKIDTIIIHSSYNAMGGDIHNLETIINQEYRPAGVAPHYIISRQGRIYRLVADHNIAYHAGVSKMPDGRTRVNNFSLGIEIVETQSESPTDAQYEALKKLVTYLKDKYKIKHVLGHSDIAPGRKTDPWNFNWKKVGKEK